MTDTSDSRVSLVEEDSNAISVTPTTPEMETFDMTDQSIQLITQKQRSNIITQNRDTRDIVRLSKSSAGELNTEMVYPTRDVTAGREGEALYVAIRAIMCDEAEDAQVVTTDCAMLAGNSVITKASFDFAAAGYKIGDLVLTSLTTNAVDSRICRVTGVAVGTLTIELPDSGAWQTDDASITVTRGARMENGTYRRYFTVAREWLELVKMIAWTGQVFNTMTINAAIGQLTTIKFGLIGFDGEPQAMASTTQAFTDCTYQTQTVSPVFEPTSVVDVVINAVAYPASSFSLAVNNNARIRSQFGTELPDALPVGSFDVSGTLGAYFAFIEPLTILYDDSTVPMWVSLKDDDGKYFAISLDAVEFDAAPVNTAGPNQDEMVDITWTAKEASWSGGTTMRLFRFE